MQNISALVKKELDQSSRKVRDAISKDLQVDPSKQAAKDAKNLESSIAFDFAQMLPYEVFDDTEFEQRTISEWLNMTEPLEDAESLAQSFNAKGLPAAEWVDTLSGREIAYAKIPIPAKALCGSEWKNCLVTAYNHVSDLWKVTWKKTSGWQLEHLMDDDEESEEEVDIPASRPETSATDENEPVLKREVWIHRYAV